MTDAIAIEDGGERGIIESIVRGKPKAGRVHRQLPRRLPHQLNRQRVECRAISPAPPSKRNKEMIRHFITAALVTCAATLVPSWVRQDSLYRSWRVEDTP